MNKEQKVNKIKREFNSYYRRIASKENMIGEW
jgi:hypothetical protein